MEGIVTLCYTMIVIFLNKSYNIRLLSFLSFYGSGGMRLAIALPLVLKGVVLTGVVTTFIRSSDCLYL